MISTIEKTHAIEIWDLEFELIISQVKHHVITQKPPRDRQKQICHITKNQVMPLLSHVLVIYTYILRTNATHYYYMRFLYSEKSLTDGHMNLISKMWNKWHTCTCFCMYMSIPYHFVLKIIYFTPLQYKWSMFYILS